MKDVFTKIYKTNHWGNDQTVSGPGSMIEQTETIRRELPALFDRLRIKSILDIPCGDHYWGRLMRWPEQYIGADIVPEIIEENQRQFPDLDFRVLDITKDELPKADLVLVRDLFGHFSNQDVLLALENLRASGSTYLLATTFPSTMVIGDIPTGEWRPINLNQFPGLAVPLRLIRENPESSDADLWDKSLGLYKLNKRGTP